MYLKTLAAVIAVSSITACGGGGGSSESAEPKVSNAAPVATNVAIHRNNAVLTSNDILLLNDVITFHYDYQDAENDSQGGSVFEWQRTETDGNLTIIAGVTSNSYTVTAEDLTMMISASVVPVATTGTLEGAAVYSPAIKVSGDTVSENSAPIAVNAKLLRNGVLLTNDDSLLLGDVVSFSYEYQDAESDAQGSSVIRWQRTDNESNATTIAGAVSNNYTIIAEDVAKNISASVTPVAMTGTQEGETVVSFAINVSNDTSSENSAPIATNVQLLRNGAIVSGSDTLLLGDAISVTYEYQDAESDTQGSSVFEWQRTDLDNNVTVIAAATSNSYTVTNNDLAMGISASVKPIATAGILEGVAVVSLVVDVENNTAPVATDIEINAEADEFKVGSLLTGNYSFSDAEGDTEGVSLYRWLAISEDTTETELGTERTLTLPHAALNNNIVFEVTPVATTGLIDGVENRSASQKVISDYAFFTANVPVIIDAINGIAENQPHLFITNGTEEGTTQLLNLDEALITQPLAVGSKWVFLHNRNAKSNELMVTDGTPEGTSVIISSISERYPDNLVSVNGLVYFSAYDTTNGRELWSTDSTVENTQIVANINPGGGSSSPSGFAMLGDRLYFSAQGYDSDNNSTGQELFSVSSNNTVELVKDINPGTVGSNPGSLTVFKDLLYFRAWDGNTASSTGGNELWVSDGTPNGTHMVKDLTVGAHSYPTNFTVVGDDLYFTTITNGGDLWRTRGTAETTTKAGHYNHQAVSQLTAFNNKLIYRAAVSGQEDILWAAEANTDTHTDQTSLDGAKNPDHVIVFGDRVMFKSTGRNGGDYELYSMDNEQIVHSDVPKLIQNINSTGSSNPNDLLELNGVVLFSADDGTTGRELWSSDGESAVLLKDIITGSEGSDPQLKLPSFIQIPD